MAESIILPNRSPTSKNNNPYIETACKDCGLRQMRRKDAVKIWNDRCKKCSAKINNNRPEIIDQRVAARLKTMSEWPEERRQARVEALRQQIARQGGVPNAKKFIKGEMVGEKSYSWKGGITPQSRRERNSDRYKEWRTTVLRRDNYTCQLCGIRGGKLQADHILAWSTHPELRFELSNGRTLCVPCHKATPNYGWRATRLPVSI